MRRHDRDSEAGAVAILVAICLTMLLIAAAMVLDFGLARLDRQINKASTDSAALAGAQAAADDGTGRAFLFRGACASLEFVKANHPLLASLTGTWTNGAGGAASAPCDPTSATNATECVNGSSSTFARFDGQANDVSVRIMAGYQISSGPWPEDALITGDDSIEGGCDQIAVIIQQSRTPGLGSLATSGDLTTTLRSVARVNIGPGDRPIALLLLEREDCAVLANSGVNARIHVLGTPAMTPPSGPPILSSPGLIHADSLGSGDDCGPGSNIFDGNHSNGIVADASIGVPVVPGQITTVALSGAAGAVPGKASDPYDEVVVSPGPPNVPSGRELVSRKPVDDMYLSGVRAAVVAAQADAFATVTAANALSNGYTKIIGCNPTPLVLGAITAADSVYVDCPGKFDADDITINGWRVFFDGYIAGAANLSLPYATRVYVYGRTGSNAVGFDSGDNFAMHNYGPSITPCDVLPSTSKAQLFVKHGQLKATGGMLRLCHTTLIMMGGEDDACLPTMLGAPTETPCNGGTEPGTSQVSIAGGAAQDWTAPNESNFPIADKSDLEDLALWSESYGSGSDYSMAGSGNMRLRGVFMVPNAEPFNIKGGGLQDVLDSQYIATKLNVTGNGTLLMQPTSNVVLIPPPPDPRLVR